MTTAYTVDDAFGIYYGAWSHGFGIRDIISPRAWVSQRVYARGKLGFSHIANRYPMSHVLLEIL